LIITAMQLFASTTACQADLSVEVEQLKRADAVESARAAVLLLGDNGKVVGRKNRMGH